MGNRTGRGKQRAPPLFVRRHTGGHLVKLIKFINPEKLIDISVAVVTLGRFTIVRQEVESGWPFLGMQGNRIARQLNIKMLFRQIDNIRTEHLCLRPGSRKKYLVITR
ncbi:hypothetical protein GZ77_07245 [Endozoicomonas montiporae]|uniref:Uncharacterized protein n=1 Tax=Endozoicomonas montiporae TaxID=1027273 RepID=A0A081N6Z0_9GAMM|nr:hypothetical protein GZ77_07245 [Endozoicomonas montiporae]